MIDLFQDRRIFANSKKRPLMKNVLPQIKYSPNVSKKLNDDLLLVNPNSRLLYNYQPLSNILISKKITPPNPQQVTLLLTKKKPAQNPNLHNFKIRRQSTKKMTDNQKESQDDFQNRMNSTSLSRRSRMSSRKQKNQLDQLQQESPKLTKVHNQPTFMIVRGNNNEDLVRQVLLQRKIWKQMKIGQGVPNFKWVFYKDKHNYKKMWSYTKKKVINHFQFNQELCTKDQLVKNLQIYCQTKKIEIFSITPITFILDFDDQYCEYNLKQFIAFFQKNDPRKGSKKGWPYSFMGKIQNYMAWQNSEIKKKVNVLSKPLNSSTYYTQNSYMWLLKPTGLNRGRGIELFDSLEDLQRILLEFLAMMNRKKMKEKNDKVEKTDKNDKVNDKTIDKEVKESQKMSSSKDITIQGDSSPVSQAKFSSQKFKLNTCSFVIQKYVEKPMLIHDRKFDIRAWALLTDELNVYFFKEAYIRTSAQTYSTQNIDNYFIHLTNNAIQKQSQNYGTFQSGNQLSFWRLQQFLPQNQVFNIWNRIKQITYMTFSSVKKKINSNQRKSCFEIFGLDFIIDAENKVWLIEVNQNPCLQCSSPLLTQLFPRLINDAFKLTIDRVMEKKPEEKAYPVDGHRDGSNLWQHLGQLVPNSEYSPQKKK